jgi:toxin ParE1/3/4
MTSNEDEEEYALTLTLEAQGDFRDIIQCTIETWGEAQSFVYQDKLTMGLETLRRNPRIGRSREDILPDYRVYNVGKHIIIYWLTGRSITVIRILHERMDPTKHLRSV